MTSRRNQLLKKLVGTAIGEDEKKLYQLTIERIFIRNPEYHVSLGKKNRRGTRLAGSLVAVVSGSLVCFFHCCKLTR